MTLIVNNKQLKNQFICSSNKYQNVSFDWPPKSRCASCTCKSEICFHMVRHPVSPHKTSADHTKLIKSINAAKDNLIEQSRRWQEIVAGSHRQHISGVNIRFLSFVLHTALISCFLCRNADKEPAADPELCRLGSPRVQSQWSL